MKHSKLFSYTLTAKLSDIWWNEHNLKSTNFAIGNSLVCFVVIAYRHLDRTLFLYYSKTMHILQAGLLVISSVQNKLSNHVTVDGGKHLSKNHKTNINYDVCHFIFTKVNFIFLNMSVNIAFTCALKQDVIFIINNFDTLHAWFCCCTNMCT